MRQESRRQETLGFRMFAKLESNLPAGGLEFKGEGETR
jgi:hypothetical protein